MESTALETTPSTLLINENYSSQQQSSCAHAHLENRVQNISTEHNLHAPPFRPTVQRTGRRKRTEPVKYDFGLTSEERREQKLLKLALAKSIHETKLNRATECSPALTFYPTREEFASPTAYIAKIQTQAEQAGICKIVPPQGWNPPFAIDIDNNQTIFDTRLQHIHKLQEGIEYDDGRKHTFRSYQAAGNAFRQHWLSTRGMNAMSITSAEIEQEYWRIVESGTQAVRVEYANDLDTTHVGSGFLRCLDPFTTVSKDKEVVDFNNPEYYRTSAWNLNNLPFAHGSLLRHMNTTINGINVPWLYCGMLFATFCWHTEDNYMYSVNYQHLGAKKRWYGIPAQGSDRFEQVLKGRVPERFRESPDLLFHLTTMVTPSVLQSHGIQVYTLIQEPGEFVITFPRAYHAGFSEGFNVNEACNFVLPSWIQYGRQAIERYREVGRSSIFSHDRFIFHFGSSQSLDEYNTRECELLLQELRWMFQEEQRLKKELQMIGLEHLLELSGDVQLDDRSMELDEVRECYACKHNVYFSGVICTCCPTRLSCLRHVKGMCRCVIQNRTIMQWISPAELRFAIRRVQMKIQTLKRSETIGKEIVIMDENVGDIQVKEDLQVQVSM